MKLFNKVSTRHTYYLEVAELNPLPPPSEQISIVAQPLTD
jgi:hypothetical protein